MSKVSEVSSPSVGNAYVKYISELAKGITPMTKEAFEVEFAARKEANKLALTEQQVTILKAMGWEAKEHTPANGRNEGVAGMYLTKDKESRVNTGFHLLDRESLAIAKKRLQDNIDAITVCLEGIGQ